MSRSRKPRPLTPRQKTVWEFIAREVKKQGFPPTFREIGIEFNIGSTNGVRAMLDAIEKKGFIKRIAYLSRGLEILKWPDGMQNESELQNVVRIPIVGRVAAGTPLLADLNIEGEVLMDRSLFPAGDGFALRVKGESMIEAGINDGDIVLARPDLPIEKGSIVIALLEDEATVKYYFPDQVGVKLMPGNPTFDPIMIKKNTPGFSIVGKVVGLYRRY